MTVSKLFIEVVFKYGSAVMCNLAQAKLIGLC